MRKFHHSTLAVVMFARLILIALTMASLFLGVEEVKARKFDGLKVHGDYKVLEPLVGEIPHNRSGLTREDVVEFARQKLWGAGIKPARPLYRTHFLEIDLVIQSKGTNFSVEVSLKKMSQAYGYDPKVVGPVVQLPQGGYGMFGNAGRDKSYILKAVGEVMDEFIADYKDSNLN